MQRVLVLAAAATLVACGGSDLTNPGVCTVTLSGAVTATKTCVVGAAHDNASNQTAIAINVQGGSGQPSFAFALNMGSADPLATTYTQASPGEAGSTYMAADNKTWLQLAHDHGGAPDQGTYSLKISDLGTTITASGGKAWPLIHGTLDATLKAQTATGASGDLVAKVTF